MPPLEHSSAGKRSEHVSSCSARAVPPPPFLRRLEEWPDAVATVVARHNDRAVTLATAFRMSRAPKRAWSARCATPH